MMTNAGSSRQAPPAEVPGPAAGAKRRAGGERIAREAAARRALFVASLAGFAVIFGLIAVSGKPAPAAGQRSPGGGIAVDLERRVIAEVPVTNLDGAGGEAIIRIIAPDSRASEPRASEPRLRTRAS